LKPQLRSHVANVSHEPGELGGNGSEGTCIDVYAATITATMTAR
jgi:hypothetical protein